MVSGLWVVQTPELCCPRGLRIEHVACNPLILVTIGYNGIVALCDGSRVEMVCGHFNSLSD
jgi:hypothetical protein